MTERLRDYRSELSIGKILGRSGNNVSGHNEDINSTEEVVWDYGGLYTYLESNTTLYVSSDDPADTDVDITVVGLDENGALVSGTANTDGQNQIAITGASFWRLVPPHVYVSGNTAPVGDLYIAESDTLTGGIPDTATKIKAMIVNPNNTTRMGLTTVPAGKSVLVKSIRGSVGKLQDAKMIFRIRYYGGVWLRLNPFNIYQDHFQFDYPFGGIIFPQLTDFEMRASSTVNAAISLEVDGEYVETAKLGGEVK